MAIHSIQQKTNSGSWIEIGNTSPWSSIVTGSSNIMKFTYKAIDLYGNESEEVSTFIKFGARLDIDYSTSLIGAEFSIDNKIILPITGNIDIFPVICDGINVLPSSNCVTEMSIWVRRSLPDVSDWFVMNQSSIFSNSNNIDTKKRSYSFTSPSINWITFFNSLDDPIILSSAKAINIGLSFKDYVGTNSQICSITNDIYNNHSITILHPRNGYIYNYSIDSVDGVIV